MIPYFLGGFGPTIAAYISIAATRRRSGFKEFHSRLLRVRVGVVWYLLAFLITFGIGFLSIGLFGLIRRDFYSGVSQYGTSFWIFSIGVLGISLTLTWFYNRTESILICVIYHAAANMVASMGILVPAEQPLGATVEALVKLVVGIVLVLVFRQRVAVPETIRNYTRPGSAA